MRARERLRQWRVERDMTREQLGERCGVSGSMIGKLELGIRNPGRRIANRLERVTDGAVRAVDWDDDEDEQATECA